MTTTINQFVKAALCTALLVAAGCGDDGGGNSSDADVNDTIDASVEEYTCDPVGANPAVGLLLNAPLDSSVEVIVKDPRHPGDPGPSNLP
jgi:hypothetical protein